MRKVKNLAKWLVLVAGFSISHPASAVRVTNLDVTPHTITYESSGNVHQATLAAGETVDFVGLPDGILSLKASAPKPSKSNLHADGLLSGIVGAVRNQNIPAGNEDDFAIWPGEQLLLQHHRRDQSKH